MDFDPRQGQAAVITGTEKEVKFVLHSPPSNHGQKVDCLNKCIAGSLYFELTSHFCLIMCTHITYLFIYYVRTYTMTFPKPLVKRSDWFVWKMYVSQCSMLVRCEA